MSVSPVANELEDFGFNTPIGREPKRLKRTTKEQAARQIDEWLQKEREKELGGANTPFFSLSLPEYERRGKLVVGREKEISQILSMSFVEGGGRPLLVGPTGIGKFSIILKAAHLLKTTYNSPHIRYKGIKCLNPHRMEESEEESFSEQIKKSIRKCYEKNELNLLCIKNIDNLVRKLSTSGEHGEDTHLGFFDNRYPFIATINGDPKDPKTQEIITLLQRHRFEPIYIKESPIEEVEEIVLTMLKEHSALKNVVIDKETIPFAVKLSEKHIRHIPFPIKTIQMLAECSHRLMLERLSTNDNVNQQKVTKENLAKYISIKTDVKTEDLLQNLAYDPSQFKEKMLNTIVGQEHAIQVLSQAVTAFKLGLNHKGKPPGVFLFYGPTGVGKTELAKQLSLFLFGKDSLVRIDGGEFQEPHSISRLIGAPPGYEGHETGGHLTEALHQRPLRVVLVDEFEKMHPEVRKIFLHVLDEGRLTDGRGRTVDCTNVFFIMTTNLGANLLTLGDKEKESSVKELLINSLSPELFNRFHAVIPFNAINEAHIPQVINVQLKEIQERVKEPAGIDFQWDGELVKYFRSIHFDQSMGMRNLCRTIDQEVTKALVQFLPSRLPFRGTLLMTSSDSKIQIKAKRVT